MMYIPILETIQSLFDDTEVLKQVFLSFFNGLLLYLYITIIMYRLNLVTSPLMKICGTIAMGHTFLLTLFTLSIKTSCRLFCIRTTWKCAIQLDPNA